MLARTPTVRYMITLRHLLSPAQQTTAQAIARLREEQPLVLRAAASLIANPCSLAQPRHDWLPPTIELPGTPRLTLEISRSRVTPHLTSRLRAWSPDETLLHPPAFLLKLRVLGGGDRGTARNWVRAMLPDLAPHTLHELIDAPTPTFHLILDARFHPLTSPYWLFQGQLAA
ncbi:hypothetical protein CCANI_05360 [Corynebacterium canis]|nr:hypothetical protein CCANI_05360 [Corynebacterium canis]